MRNKAYGRGLIFGALIAAMLFGSTAVQAGRYYRGGGGQSSGRARPRAEMSRHQPHFYIGADLIFLGVLSQKTDFSNGYLGPGGGGGLFAGYRLNRHFSLEINWMTTSHDETFSAADTRFVDVDSFFLMSFTLDGKLHLPTRSNIEPYLQAGFGFVLAGATYGPNANGDAIYAKGPAMNLGGGVDIWLRPWLTLGGRLLYRGLFFGEPEVSAGQRDRNFVSGVSVDANIAYHF